MLASILDECGYLHCVWRCKIFFAANEDLSIPEGIGLEVFDSLACFYVVVECLVCECAEVLKYSSEYGVLLLMRSTTCWTCKLLSWL